MTVFGKRLQAEMVADDRLAGDRSPAIVSVRHGRLQAVLAVGVGAVGAGVTVATATRAEEAVTRLAMLGLALFGLAVVAGWALGVGLSVLPGLSAAVVEMVAVESQGWLRALVIGCLWYGAAELGWDSIERRDGHHRTGEVTRRRLQEWGTVIALSLALVLASLAMIESAPARSLPVQALALLVTVSALWAAMTHLRRTAAPGEPTDADEPPGTDPRQGPG